MKLRSICTALGLTAFTLCVSVLPAFSQDEVNNFSDQVTFSCETKMDLVNNEKNPTTVAWISGKTTPIQLIVWKSKYFQESGWTRQKRCEIVSKKFQTALDSGRYYLVAGEIGSYPIVCAVNSLNQTCDKNYQLFQLQIGSKAEEILERLISIQDGVNSSPIWQSSGDRKYLNIYDYLKKASSVNID
ncbi:COP23 domain-containing protein [Dolichospermum circinale]|uniref:COP23 domain-containing protein n=1 Tax=Dolichospermum circinale TaxID=109265 RepID=UPI00232D2D0B|nr:COP23 domain-containing protein [Dolichospermum circinale]MDB9455932.1 COP23 domain-containing protein [Dolichospermum circinale CS-541/06]MDB9461322.1 COP23 domain-containing protein [Dolichospermum circinale CS-541/04]MDB9546352.1 COP23 domain-containing protein [Dolichospermum circinale CS-1031]